MLQAMFSQRMAVRTDSDGWVRIFNGSERVTISRVFKGAKVVGMKDEVNFFSWHEDIYFLEF